MLDDGYYWLKVSEKYNWFPVEFSGGCFWFEDGQGLYDHKPNCTIGELKQAGYIINKERIKYPNE